MKKSIIAAGAASVALAAMPIVGAFATTQINGSPIVDTLSATVTDACTFSRLVTSGDAGHPEAAGAPSGASWTEGTYATATTVNDRTIPADTDHDTFTASVVAGNTYDAIAKSAFQIVCNNATGGYKVTAYPANLAGTSTNINYNAEDTTPGYATSGSSWYLTSTAATATGANPVVWSHSAYDSSVQGSTTLDSENFTITYNLKVALDQAVDTYTGSVVYELATL